MHGAIWIAALCDAAQFVEPDSFKVILLAETSTSLGEKTMRYLLLILSLAAGTVFGAAGAQAFNPQPDPPGVHGGE